MNRELSWLEFNRRVLEEAPDATVPLLERVKFLAIFSSNLDEFFMVRVAELKRRIRAGDTGAGPDGLSAGETLTAVAEKVHRLVDAQHRCFLEELGPVLAAEGIRYLEHARAPSTSATTGRRSTGWPPRTGCRATSTTGWSWPGPGPPAAVPDPRGPGAAAHRHRQGARDPDRRHLDPGVDPRGRRGALAGAALRAGRRAAARARRGGRLSRVTARREPPGREPAGRRPAGESALRDSRRDRAGRSDGLARP